MDMERFILQATQSECEPYSVTIPANVQPWESTTIKTASQPTFGRQTVTMEAGGGFGLPVLEKDQPLAKEGDKIELFGRGMGYEIGGVRLNGKVIYWRTTEQSAAHHRRFKENFAAQQERHKATFVPDPSWLHSFKKKIQEDDSVVRNWDEVVRENSEDSYSYGIVAFASQWAARMEALITEKKANVADIAEDACQDVLKVSDHELGGLTGNMYGMATHLLAVYWERGEELRLWHNINTQMGTEGEKANKEGGILNPAVFTTGKN